jgi:hypothetical protein
MTMSEESGKDRGAELSTHDYGHLTVEDEPEAAEEASRPEELRPSPSERPRIKISSHDYGHLSVEDEPSGTVDPADVADTAGQEDDT